MKFAHKTSGMYSRSRDVVSKRLVLVLVSWKHGKVSISSRTENQMSRLCLVPQGLVYKPICTAFCSIAKLHVHRFEHKASILFADSQANVSFTSLLRTFAIAMQYTLFKKSFSLTLQMQNLWSRLHSQLSEACLPQCRVETQSKLSWPIIVLYRFLILLSTVCKHWW